MEKKSVYHETKFILVLILPQGVPTAKFPPLTALGPLEQQGLVARDPEGRPITFGKEWDAKRMCLFFQKHLPRPFQYFAEQGYNVQTATNSEDSLPYRVLSKVRNTYHVVSAPNADKDFNGKFYQRHASGCDGSSYKQRYILLGQYAQAHAVAYYS